MRLLSLEQACYATCYQRYVIERCGCADSQYPMEGAAFDYKRVSACNSNNEKEDTCRYRVFIDYTYNRLDCDCPLPCEETAYTYQTSNSAWPSELHKEIIKQKLAAGIAKYLGNTTDDDKLWKNLLTVQVYYEDFNYEKIEETPSYTTVNFASDIGGILGLWIGCSIISLFEFLELSMDCIALAVMRLFRRRRPKRVDPVSPSVKPPGSRRQPTPYTDKTVSLAELAAFGSIVYTNSYAMTCPHSHGISQPDEMSVKADRQLYTFLTPSDEAGRGERVGPGSVWRGFTDTTTSHGVPHVRRSVGVVKRFFWGMMTAVCVFILIYHLTSSCILYFSYETDVNVALVTRRQLTFPAVTICNLNPVKNSAVSESSALSRLINDARRKRKKRDTSAATKCPVTEYKTNMGNTCFWVPYTKKGNMKSFAEAKDVCKENGAHLISLESATIAFRKNNESDDTEALNVWIWLVFYKSGWWSGSWMWAGSKTDRVNMWETDYPDRNGGKCAFITRDTVDKWKNKDCDGLGLSLCERSMTYVCENGLLEIDGVAYCYWIPLDKRGTFDEAFSWCAAEDGHLAIIDSQKKITHLEETIKWPTAYGTDKMLWVWLHKEDGPFNSTWIWGERDELKNSSWANTYPEVSPMCAYLYNNGSGSENDYRWKHTGCTNHKYGLCERHDGTDSTKKCDKGHYYDSTTYTCFFISKYSRSFNDMQSNCEKELGTIAVVDTPEKMQHLQNTSMLKKGYHRSYEAWISLKIVKENNVLVWKWNGTTPLANYHAWGAGFPATKMKLSSKQKMGYSALELIVDCEFAGSECTVRYVSGQHRVVYTLDISSQTDFGGSAGVRIVVHPQERMPFPSDEGVLAAPGQLSIIGIRQLNVVRLPEPYGNCTDTTERNMKRNVYEEVYPVRYSVGACYATCYQRYVIERCGCADSQYPMEGAAFDYKRVKTCKSENTTEDTCRYQVSIEYMYNKLDCDCPLPCDVDQELVKQQLVAEIAKYLGNTTDDAKLWNNLLKVKVYYEDFNYENIEETPSYSTVNFISDIGGILGLWIGCSVISLFEFLELSMDFGVLAVLRLIRRQRTGKVRPETPPLTPDETNMTPDKVYLPPVD
ncbi:hypothetical protein NP493_686g00003 [Ridgeia piscesae]|uniref:C-type lectin domain-containing protein n=1 Tax=Ridgeia piscesae TaxID=27915 RepID=A0AAD9NQT6_RIDPI|nr:hypothetical protein NP493_686g00003 [Ridgeia piscesae]